MKKNLCFFAALTIGFSAASSVHAEYCEDQFYKDMASVNEKLGADLVWQRDKQSEALKLISAKDIESKNIATIASRADLSAQDKVAQIQAHSAVISDIQNKLTAINDQNVAKNQEINELRTTVSQSLVAKAQECAKKIAPLNLIVNIAVQGLALFFTDGASAVLPAKALYVDMGEIASGNLMGGSHSAPNEIKDWINGRLGLHL
ncbi:hypothetical protein [Burkholderia cenocepacia]|uniref:hypothetical protein n=1 Tax=Burkholderia cenocepacia TaxID=95486 RepID=UPI002AB771CC|nr:hypothetical protein [Burkholderia cenocepacia]